MKRLILIAALSAPLPVAAQQAVPQPDVIVEDTAPVATGVVVGLLAVLALAVALASLGD